MYIFFLIIVACGKTHTPEDEEFIQNFSLETQGFYRAPFNLVNSKLSKGVKGRASFFINPVQFYAKVNLSTPWKEFMHIQMLHEGSDCPTKNDDVNLDGYVDGMEAALVSGKAIIPLDFDIKSQKSKFRDYPVSDDSGEYVYSLATSTPAMMSDLRSGRADQLDYLGKLGPREDLKLLHRVVIIYGVPDSIYLPSSVLGFEGFPAHMTLPIACGRFQETEEVFP